MTARATRQLLGGRTPAAFLARYWQKEPLLLRQAVPAFTGVLDRDALFALARRDDVESRLVQRMRGRYTLHHGPFRRAALERLPARDWTLLVQGVDRHVDAADAMLRRFAFIPFARLDDVMVSYAAPGGGVGPHFDSYDVFLLQAAGRRRWRYGRQADLTVRRGAPLALLRRFTPEHDATLEPGDMLYVPPGVAHEGASAETRKSSAYQPSLLVRASAPMRSRSRIVRPANGVRSARTSEKSPGRPPVHAGRVPSVLPKIPLMLSG
jgi:50S ribosomal protein L16 3-hydroxylase